MSGCWLQTFSGKAVFPLQPRIEDICIDDIAHALSLLCRFGGHVKKFYSVAEHCVRASYEVPLEHALWALLHDASEAYLIDLPRPLKHDPDTGRTYRAAESRLMRVICQRFGLPEQEPAEVKQADNRLLNTEQRDLMGPQVMPWSVNDLAPALSRKIEPWSSDMAEELFLRRFYALSSPDYWATSLELELPCSKL